MRRVALDPLGMAWSSFVWRSAYSQQAASGHDGEGWPVPKSKPARGNAAWSLHTSAPDFARFLGAILSPGREMSDRVEEMLSPQISLGNALSWGLGWGLGRFGDDTVLWHWGDNPGFTCFTAALRRRRCGVVILTNGDCGAEICESLARATLGLGDEIFSWLAGRW